MEKEAKVEEYLIKNIEHLDFIIDQVLILLPESFFYKPDINNAYFKGLRSEISEVKQKMNSMAYRYDKGARKTYLELLKRYDWELSQRAEENRQSMLVGLKQEDEGMKLACLFNLILYYRLLDRLRTFNN